MYGRVASGGDTRGGAGSRYSNVQWNVSFSRVQQLRVPAPRSTAARAKLELPWHSPRARPRPFPSVSSSVSAAAAAAHLRKP